MTTDTIDYIIPGDRDKSIDYCVNHLIDTGKKSIISRGKFFLVLSGGSTPREIFHCLLNHERVSEIDWGSVHLFWGDERNVPKDNAENNYHMAMETCFKHLPIPLCQIHRMVAEKDIDKNTQSYEQTIKATLGDNPFDLIQLGIGTDGHTASLFPNTEALNTDDRLVVANYIPEKETTRMTLTFPAINNARKIVFYVFGKNKSDIISFIFSDKAKQYPASKVGSSSNRPLWILDKNAASKLH